MSFGRLAAWRKGCQLQTQRGLDSCAAANHKAFWRWRRTCDKCGSHLEIADVMKQVPWWGPTILKWPLNLGLIWCFLFGVCEPIHVLVCKGKGRETATIVLEILAPPYESLCPTGARDLCTPDIVRVTLVSHPARCLFFQNNAAFRKKDLLKGYGGSHFCPTQCQPQ